MDKIITSPIRWSGSKRKIIKHILPLINDNERYIEPFLGSATMLINILSKKNYNEYYVNDINHDLINFFIQLKENPDFLVEQISDMSKTYLTFSTITDKEIYYYSIRDFYNNNQVDYVTRAAFFWFLNKTCFNGVYRLNSKGKYNVPFGKRDNANFNIELFLQISELIQNVSFSNLDYLEFIRSLSENHLLENSFIYLDPPYIPETVQTQNHRIYTSSFFQHDRFTDFINVLSNSPNAEIMLSMSDSSYSQQIYNHLVLHKKKITDIARVVNPKAILTSSEIIYTNYPL